MKFSEIIYFVKYQGLEKDSFVSDSDHDSQKRMINLRKYQNSKL